MQRTKRLRIVAYVVVALGFGVVMVREGLLQARVKEADLALRQVEETIRDIETLGRIEGRHRDKMGEVRSAMYALSDRIEAFPYYASTSTGRSRIGPGFIDDNYIEVKDIVRTVAMIRARISAASVLSVFGSSANAEQASNLEEEERFQSAFIDPRRPAPPPSDHW